MCWRRGCCGPPSLRGCCAKCAAHAASPGSTAAMHSLTQACLPVDLTLCRCLIVYVIVCVIVCVCVYV